MEGEGNFQAAGILLCHQIPCMNFFFQVTKHINNFKTKICRTQGQCSSTRLKSESRNLKRGSQEGVGCNILFIHNIILSTSNAIVIPVSVLLLFYFLTEKTDQFFWTVEKGHFLNFVVCIRNRQRILWLPLNVCLYHTGILTIIW